MTSNHLGIDPGLSGGLVYLEDGQIRYKIVMPTVTIAHKSGALKKEIDRHGVSSFLTCIPRHTHAAIEEQEAYRGQNVVSSCTICKNYGILLMALHDAHLFITEVPSDLWQDHFGIVSKKKADGKSTKAQAYPIAQALYPEADFRKSDRSHIPHDGIVDATLIANYCQSLFPCLPPDPRYVATAAFSEMLKDNVEKLQVRLGGK